MTKRRKIALFVASPFVIVGLAIGWANWEVERLSRSRIYTKADQVPRRDIGIVLGTSPRTRGAANPFFERRLDAAAELYRANRVRCLLVSGDHGSRYYNEVSAMEKGLVSRGVPKTKIVLDHAGFRTLDSLARARKVFGVRDAVVVTDDFHLPRSLYLAKHFGIDAVGLSSVPVSTQVAPGPSTREIGARVLMMIDLYVTGRKPKYLGEPVRLPD